MRDRLMRMASVLNPFIWSRRTIMAVLLAVYILGGSIYICGLSVFATNTGEMVGSLRVPTAKISVKLNAAVLEGNNLITPTKNAAVYRADDGLFIYGHNTTALKGLDEIEIDDLVYYVDQSGETSTYKVEKLVWMDVDEIDMNGILTNIDGEKLVMMTCAGELEGDDYSERLLVFAAKQ